MCWVVLTKKPRQRSSKSKIHVCNQDNKNLLDAIRASAEERCLHDFACVVKTYLPVVARTGAILSLPQVVIFVLFAIVCDCLCFSRIAKRSWRIAALALLLRSSESWQLGYGVCQSILCRLCK